jgi:hypothetical protein
METIDIMNNNYFPLIHETMYIDKHYEIKETIVYLYYQLCRKEKKIDLQNLSIILGELLSFLKNEMYSDEKNKAIYVNYLLQLYKMIAQTRDIENGKGEQDITYMMIYTWYQSFPLLAILAVKAIVGSYDVLENQYLLDDRFGCWKDIKHLCEYIRDHSVFGEKHPLIDTCIEILIKQLHQDYIAINNNLDNKKIKISLAAKWVPRENKHYGWLYDKCVRTWYKKMWKYMLLTPRDNFEKELAMNKCRMNFRKIVSNMNKYLDTIEIKQCSREWSKINPNKINTKTFILQKNALLNRNKDADSYSIDDMTDRYKCSQNIHDYLYSDKILKNIPKNYLTQNENNEKVIFYGFSNILKTSSSKLRNIPIYYYVKRAYELINLTNHKQCSQTIENEIQLLNKQWKCSLKYCMKLENMIPVIDCKFQYYENNYDLLYNIIGMACFICEKSSIYKRILFITNEKPVWINLSNCSDFLSMITEIKNIMDSFLQIDENIDNKNYNILIESIMNTNMSNENVEKMVLVILQNWENKKHIQHFHSNMKNIFMNYDTIPHIIYWNFSDKLVHHMPCNILDSRTSLVSGTNISLINHFNFMIIPSVRNMDPYTNVLNILKNDKYIIMEKLFYKLYDNNK